MKCAQCGLPLSPSRSTCPRCGTPIPKAAGKGQSAPSPQPSSGTNYPGSPNPPGIQQQPNPPGMQQQWNAFPPANPWEGQGGAPMQQYPFGASSSDATMVDPPKAPANQAYPGWNPTPFAAPQQTYTPFQGQRAMMPQKNRTKLGFTVAGICVAAGAILIVVIFIMAQSVGGSGTPTANTSPQSSPTAAPTQAVEATPTSPPVTPTAAPSATPTLAGSQYVTNIQMGNALDTNTYTVTQTATSFTSTQTIYVSMTIEKAAFNGAVCMNWTFNNVSVYKPTPVTLSNQGGDHYNYYTTFGPSGAGSGSLEIDWSTDATCTNPVQVQTLTFTITG